MPRYISLRYISIAILVVALIPISAIAYKFITYSIDNQLADNKQKIQAQTNATFDAFISQKLTQLVLVAEEVVFLTKLESLSAQQVASSLEETFSRLELSHSLNGMALINPSQNVRVFGNRSSTQPAARYASLQQSLLPIKSVECHLECYLSVMIPLTIEGELWALAVSAELTDPLLEFSELKSLDVGLVLPQRNSANARHWQGSSLPVLTSPERSFQLIHQAASKDDLFDQGDEVNFNHKSYFIWGHHYQQTNSTPFDLLLIYDLTHVLTGSKLRTSHAAVLMGVLLCATIIVIILCSTSPIRRLQTLTNVVKRIGQKDYSGSIGLLKQQPPSRWLIDEIATVHQALQLTSESLQRYEQQLNQSQTELQYAANHDSVTGLKNRYAFSNQFNALAESSRNHHIAILLVDINDFNAMNDNLGHEVGDTILKAVAERLAQLTTEHIEVYRFGGDEYLVLAELSEGNEQIEQLVNALLKQFLAPTAINETYLHIEVSLGFASNDSADESFKRLTAQAVLALHEAKATAQQWLAFTPALEFKAQMQFLIKSDFARSLANQEFSLHYQPMINFHDKRLVKMEALIRWHHHVLGPIYPDQFIPVLEKSGQINQLTDWILLESARQIQKLDLQGHNDVKISVNISGQQVVEISYIERIHQLLKQNGASAERIELEITETSLVKDFEIARGWVAEAKAAGFKVAMDDFGTGYSSLSYLTSIDFDTIKIDRSLIDQVVTDPVQQNIVVSLVNMVASLGLHIVVEGIEESEQFQLLKLLKCNVAQGYHISRPLSADKLQIALANYQPEQGWACT